MITLVVGEKQKADDANAKRSVLIRICSLLQFFLVAFIYLPLWVVMEFESTKDLIVLMVILFNLLLSITITTPYWFKIFLLDNHVNTLFLQKRLWQDSLSLVMSLAIPYLIYFFPNL